MPTEDGDISNTVILRSFAYQSEEPLWIAQEILSLLRSGIGPQQVAVLFRSGKDPVARELTRRLIHMGVPVRSVLDPQSVAADPLVAAAIEVLRYLSASPENRNDIFVRLTVYRNCPLQFKFVQHLSLEEVASDAMTLGTLIHDVLQAYHDPEANLPRTRETLESLADQLFDPAAFSRPAVARQVRAKATELLDLYFRIERHASGIRSESFPSKFRILETWP